MPELSSRTKGFTDSVIRRMTRISNQYNAINLSQGFPDFDPPKEILDRLAEISHTGPHQYSITWGAQNFREALAKKQSRLMGRTIDPNSEIVVTCGSTEAMMAAMMSVTNPGDKVIVFSPFYENYGADTILADAEPIYVPLVPPQFNFDADVLEEAFKQNPKALILCNPSNPSGKVFSYDELKIIADLAEKYDTFVITENNRTDGITFQVQSQTVRTVGEFDHLTGHYVAQTMQANDTIRYGDNRTLCACFSAGLEAANALLDQITDFSWVKLHVLFL